MPIRDSHGATLGWAMRCDLRRGVYMLLFALVLSWMGCGGRTSGDATERMIPLGEIHSLASMRAYFDEDSRKSGLHALGDINGDGVTDLVVSASGQRGSEGRRGGVLRGWIAAFSGADGSLLWEIVGKSGQEAQAEGDESGYHLTAGAIVGGDFNGDGLPDLFVLDGYAQRRAWLISGRDGSRIGEFDYEQLFGTDRPVRYIPSRPLRMLDVDGDGVPDLVFPEAPGLGLRILSGRDFSLIAEHRDLWGDGEGPLRPHWTLPEYADDNGDGVVDFLARRLVSGSHDFEMAVISGRDFSVLRTFRTEGPRVIGQFHFAAAGDLNGDGVADYVTASSTGAGPEGRSSYLRAVSGADGAVLWTVVGSGLPGGPTRFEVDARSGEKRDLPADVGFDSAVVKIPDVDGDGVADVATVASGSDSRRAVLLFSGATGDWLGELAPTQGRIVDSPQVALVLLDTTAAGGRPALAVPCHQPGGEWFIAILSLPSS